MDWTQFQVDVEGRLCCPKCRTPIAATIDATYYQVVLYAEGGGYPSYDYDDNKGAESQIVEDGLVCPRCGWRPEVGA